MPVLPTRSRSRRSLLAAWLIVFGIGTFWITSSIYNSESEAQESFGYFEYQKALKEQQEIERNEGSQGASDLFVDQKSAKVVTVKEINYKKFSPEKIVESDLLYKNNRTEFDSSDSNFYGNQRNVLRVSKSVNEEEATKSGCENSMPQAEIVNLREQSTKIAQNILQNLDGDNNQSLQADQAFILHDSQRNRLSKIVSTGQPYELSIPADHTGVPTKSQNIELSTISSVIVLSVPVSPNSFGKPGSVFSATTIMPTPTMTSVQTPIHAPVSTNSFHSTDSRSPAKFRRPRPTSTNIREMS